MKPSKFSHPDPSPTHYRLAAFKGIHACKTKRGAAILRLAGRPDRLFRSLHILRWSVPCDRATVPPLDA